MLRVLTYGLIAIVLLMIVADLFGRRKRERSERAGRTRSRAAGTVSHSVFGHAMNPRADFPATTFDDEAAEPRQEQGAQARAGMPSRESALERLRRPAGHALGAVPAGNQPLARAAPAVRLDGADPFGRRAVPAGAAPVKDPLERAARKGSPAGGGAFNAVRLVSLSGPDQGRSFPIVAAGTVVGRHPSCQIVVGDLRVSGRHAWLGIALNKVVLRDLDSTNGTLINSEPHRVVGETELHAGDIVRFGGHKGVEFRLVIE